MPFASVWQSGAGAVHTGVTEFQPYFIYVVDANTISLHTTVQGGLDGTTNIVVLSGAGTGVNELCFLTNCNTRATLNLSQGVNMVTPRDDNGANGQYMVSFEPAFTSATSYAISGSAKRAVADPGTASIVGPDATAIASVNPLASQKMIVCTTDAGAQLTPTEVNLRAFGT